MDLAEQLRVLQAARDNPALLALTMVDLVHHTLPDEKRARIKEALVAAAVPHWCDPTFLAILVETTLEEATDLLDNLRALTVAEPFTARGELAVNIHEAARFALRDYLRSTDAARWIALSTKAHDFTSMDTSAHTRIEALYHLFAIDKQAAAEAVRTLYGEFKTDGHLETHHALTLALSELTVDARLTTDVEAITLLMSLMDPGRSERIADAKGQIKTLSRREITILNWIRNGKSNWEIAQILGVTERTVKFHVESIFSKLAVRSRTQAIAVTTEQETTHKITALSAQETSILGMVKDGKTNWDIAQSLGVSERTVRFHIESIYSKLAVTSRSEAVKVYTTKIFQFLPG